MTVYKLFLDMNHKIISYVYLHNAGVNRSILSFVERFGYYNSSIGNYFYVDIDHDGEAEWYGLHNVIKELIYKLRDEKIDKLLL